MKRVSTAGLAVVVDLEPSTYPGAVNVFNVVVDKPIGDGMVTWLLLSKADSSWKYALPLEICGNSAIVTVSGNKTPKMGDILNFRYRRRQALLADFRNGKYDEWINCVLARHKR